MQYGKESMTMKRIKHITKQDEAKHDKTHKNWMKVKLIYCQIGTCYIWGVTTLHHYKRISSRDLGLKELRIFGTEVILALPGGFSVGMV